jgi:hypothetical protein
MCMCVCVWGGSPSLTFFIVFPNRITGRFQKLLLVLLFVVSDRDEKMMQISAKQIIEVKIIAQHRLGELNVGNHY